MKEIKITPFNFLSLGWLTPFLFKGAKSTLRDEDLLTLPAKNSSENLQNVLEEFPSKSLLKSILKSYGKLIILIIFLQGCSVACILTLPTFLQQTLYYLDSRYPRTLLLIDNGVWLAIILALLQISGALFTATAGQLSVLVQVDFKTIFINAVYAKSLRLSQASSRKFTQGQILNIINVDVEKISMAIVSISTLCTAPVQVVVTVILLGRLIGVAVWGGAGTLLAILLLQMLVIGLLVSYQKQFLALGDKRLKLIREVLYGIKIIKFRALEDFFYNRIQGIRLQQLSFLKKYYAVQAYFVGFIQIAPIAMPIIAFLLFAKINGQECLNGSIIFPALTLFQGLFQPLLTVPQSVTAVVVAIVSWKRVEELLMAEEADKVEKSPVLTDTDTAISMVGCTFKWENLNVENEKPAEGRRWFRKAPVTSVEKKEQTNDSFNLKNITLEIPKGQKVAIVGAVGSGKSSLLSALIGEMPITPVLNSSPPKVIGKLAYCNQQPWILTDSIKENIVFNQQFDQQKLNKVIRACVLVADLDQFPAGLETEIGEKGVNLSGGQKARVALARALYFEPDVVFLDDPISALDAQVGQQVFQDAILGCLKDSTVLLVTHQLHLLPEMDHIVVIDQNTIAEQGSYPDLMASQNSKLSKLLKDYSLDTGKSEKKATKTKEGAAAVSPGKGGLLVAEDRKNGAVTFDVYWSYFKNCGGVLFVTVAITAALLNSATQVMTNLWLTWWVSDKYHNTLDFNMKIYGVLGCAQFAFALIINAVFLLGCFRAAKFYHPIALRKLLQAPMGFFDSQPIGRILNRLSKDVESVDQNLWILLFLSTIAVSGTISSLAFLCYVDLRMLYIAIPLLILYFFILVYYQRSNIELKRFEATYRSPLYSHVSETLAGISTVKAYHVEVSFVAKEMLLMDRSNQPTFLKMMAQMWINLRLNVISSVLTLVLALLGVTSVSNSGSNNPFVPPGPSSGGIDPNLIGVALTYALGFAGQLSLLLFASSQLENEFNSVERLQVYCEQLPKEPELLLDSDKQLVLSRWPLNGQVEFEDVTLAYPSRPDVPILKNLTFLINPGEKIGVIGRTGSGKSTLMTALFRLVDLQTGIIKIDGQVTNQIGLIKLRKSMQIIPQEPVLFSGTLRENLDVEGLYQDTDIWEILKQIGLYDYVSSLEAKLDSAILENGENLSVGQRQLVCLGRAILVQPKILIMDEATASVDGEADKLIQESIKTFFKSSTVISIAHRLNTIADFDRVMVLDQGELAEFASPYELLNDPNSLFSELCDATGPANAALLRSIALKKHNEIEI